MTAGRRVRRLGVWVRVKDGGNDRLKRRRNRQNLTQRDLAYLARCSQNTIHLLESGKMATLGESLALRICQRLDLDLEDIFEECESSPLLMKPTANDGLRRSA
jgi:DNA-binding XRE family transcriptional regulator